VLEQFSRNSLKKCGTYYSSSCKLEPPYKKYIYIYIWSYKKKNKCTRILVLIWCSKIAQKYLKIFII